VQPEQRLQVQPFEKWITRAIQQEEAVAALYVSSKNGKMAGYWKITNLQQTSSLQHGLYHKN